MDAGFDIAGLLPVEATLDGALGFELIKLEPGFVSAKFAVADKHKQPFGLVHGGVYAALSESLASMGTYLGVRSDDKIAMGMSNFTQFLRPVTEGNVFAEATAEHRGRTTWLWNVRLTDDAGRACALSRVTIAVRDRPA